MSRNGIDPTFEDVVFATGEQAWNAFRRAARCIDSRTCREFAERCVIIPDGPFAGLPFDCARQPWTALLFDQIDNHVWPEIVVVAPAQGGKTLVCFVIPLLWAALELGHNCVVGLPDEEMWGDKYAIDIKPVMQASPELSLFLPRSGAGARDGKPKEAVGLANGSVLKPMTPSGGEHTRSGFTAPYVAVTELYRFDGEPFGELKARQGAYNRFDASGDLTLERRLLAEGTLTDPQSLPWNLRQADEEDAAPISTESEILSPCPKCKTFTLWEREHLVGWQDAPSELAAAKAAAWRCPHCGKELNEAARRTAANQCRLLHRGQTIDRKGRIRGTPPAVSRLFFRVNAFQNLLVNTSELGAELWEASKLDPESPAGIAREKYLSTKKFAVPYTPPVLEFMPLRASWVRDNRTGRYPLGSLPEDCLYYTVGVDVGKFTCWYLGMAFRESGEIHIVSFGGVDTSLTRGADDQPESVESAIMATLSTIFEELDFGLAAGGASRAPDLTFVDSGWHPDVVFASCAGRKDIVPVLGRGKTNFRSTEYQRPTKTNSQVRRIGDGWHLNYVRSRHSYQLTLDADKSKLDVQSGLRVAPGTPGGIQLPRSINSRDLTKLCGHLAAELRQQVRDEQGRLVEKWVSAPGSGRKNHLLDCAGYALVAGRYLGFDLTKFGRDET